MPEERPVKLQIFILKNYRARVVKYRRGCVFKSLPPNRRKRALFTVKRSFEALIGCNGVKPIAFLLLDAIPDFLTIRIEGIPDKN
jgi:hypothetical protein